VLDLVLRCNITTDEHPMGVFHPHADKHHIKRENIGLIEVMGLAVLPSRLKQELTDLAEAAWKGEDVSGEAALEKHAAWLAELKKTYTFTQENAMDIILQETGKVFAAGLEDAGVYKNTPTGKEAFRRFAAWVNQQ
jgi:UDPglucose--hexose-1-phosphate uridylyltransferase